MKYKQSNNRGFALLYALLVMLVLLTLGLTLLQTGTLEATIANNQVRRTQAMYAAEAGLETALIELKTDSYAYNPTSYSRNLDFQKVQPGNVQTGYEVSVVSMGNNLYEITSVGKAGKAKYTQKAQVEIKEGGGYLEYVASVYGTGGRSSTIDGLAMIIGDISAAGQVDLDPGAIHTGSIIPGGSGFPELEEGWYLPAGTPTMPYVINKSINNRNSFNQLMAAINDGERYIKVSGQFSYSANVDFKGAVIECTNKIDLSGQFLNATFVTDKNITVNTLTNLQNVVLVGNKIDVDSVVTGNNILIYGEGNVTLEKLTVFTSTLIITKRSLTLIGLSSVQGSIICESFTIGSLASLVHNPNITLPILPEGIVGMSVKLQSWGVPPSE